MYDPQTAADGVDGRGAPCTACAAALWVDGEEVAAFLPYTGLKPELLADPAATGSMSHGR